jgi:serine/threonine protein kinase
MKPDNFLIGVKAKQSQVYLIDFGLSKRYKDTKTGEHIPYRDGKSLTGTARYASVNTHIGVEQSRRDDLESIGYILLYFLKGVLPWQGLPGGRNKNEKYDKMKDKKLHTTVESLCTQTPEEFARYITMCRHFRFDEKPDYVSLRHLFQNVMKRFNYDYDGQYDWVLKMNGGKPDPTAMVLAKDSKPPMP